ncbi:MAG: SDR family NAD(P)-dependent oxidoreductase, partial [Dehalococcoidia bacterium]|nr:SDR family NAD(P)-dependent oxidoreductase [Dehalococcoidia bacterium]
MDLGLKDKRAFVGGGSRGIGKAVGREFGLEGMKVALVARGPDALEECARELAEETGEDFVTIVADTGNAESVQSMVKE